MMILDNEMAVPRDDNIIFPPRISCGTHTYHCQDEELNYHCDQTHHVVYDKKDPACDACQCGPHIIPKRELGGWQSIDSPDLISKKPRDEVNAKQTRNTEAIEARDEPPISAREDSPISTPDEKFLNLHVDCGSRALTELCIKDPYFYYCSYVGLERVSNRMNLECRNHCNCVDQTGKIFNGGYMPVNAWSPIGPIKHGANKTDQNDTKKVRDETAAIEGRNEAAIQARHEDAIEARNQGTLATRNEPSIIIRDGQWLKLHVVCVSDTVTRICTSEPFSYYCTYAGLDRKRGGTFNAGCQRDCDCHDQNNKPYAPAFIPLDPWSAPLPGRKDDPGPGDEVPDAL